MSKVPKYNYCDSTMSFTNAKNRQRVINIKTLHPFFGSSFLYKVHPDRIDFYRPSFDDRKRTISSRQPGNAYSYFIVADDVPEGQYRISPDSSEDAAVLYFEDRVIVNP